MPNTHTILRQSDNCPPTDFTFCQPGLLFNEARHVRQQSAYPFVTFNALNVKTGRIDARCTLFRTLNGLISPAAAPFGSVEFTPSLPSTVLTELIETIMVEARSAGLSSVQLTHYPHCYAPQQTAHLAYCLIEQGFYVASSATNFHLAVSAEPFEKRISAAERRRLRTCQRAGFRFEQWASLDRSGLDRSGLDISAVTSFIADTRRRQGYRLTLPPAQLTALLESFADEFLVFYVTDGPVVAALCVTVRVSEAILYTFLPASNPDYNPFSPMVMLMDGLYTYCQQQGIRLLDLGTALDGDGDPKPSLMRFKRNLGAQESPKLVFRKNL